MSKNLRSVATPFPPDTRGSRFNFNLRLRMRACYDGFYATHRLYRSHQIPDESFINLIIDGAGYMGFVPTGITSKPVVTISHSCSLL